MDSMAILFSALLPPIFPASSPHPPPSPHAYLTYASFCARTGVHLPANNIPHHAMTRWMDSSWQCGSVRWSIMGTFKRAGTYKHSLRRIPGWRRMVGMNVRKRDKLPPDRRGVVPNTVTRAPPA